MRKRWLAVAGYVGAALTLAIAALVPFVLMGGITQAVAHAGLRVDEVYTGGTVARSFTRNGYLVSVYEPVQPRLLQRGGPFVQVVFSPASGLPSNVDELIDLDGDGQPDVRVRFAVPGDARASLHGAVQALNSRYRSVEPIGADSFTQLLARTGDRIVLRIPLAPRR
jgi:hypothetical protein